MQFGFASFLSSGYCLHFQATDISVTLRWNMAPQLQLPNFCKKAFDNVVSTERVGVS